MPLSLRNVCVEVAQILEREKADDVDALFASVDKLIAQAIPGIEKVPDFRLLAAIAATAGVDCAIERSDARGDAPSARLNKLRDALMFCVVIAGLAVRLDGDSPLSIDKLPEWAKEAAQFTNAHQPHRVSDESRGDLNSRLDAYVQHKGWTEDELRDQLPPLQVEDLEEALGRVLPRF